MNMPIKLASRLVALPVGLHLLRFKHPSEFTAGVKVGLYPAPVGAGKLSFVQGEAAQHVAFLQRPDDEVVIHVKDASTTLLIVDYKRAECTLATPITLDIQPLAPRSIPPSPAVQLQTTEQPAPKEPFEPFLPVKGYMVSGRQFQAPNGMVGSPAATEAIAAFAIDNQALPQGVSLAYACKKAGHQEPDVAAVPNMVGLSKVDYPITAISFLEKQGEGSSYELKGHVVFAGYPPLAIVSGKELSGPTGREVLVALRVAFIKKADQPGTPPVSVWDDPAVLKRKAGRSHKDLKAN